MGRGPIWEEEEEEEGKEWVKRHRKRSKYIRKAKIIMNLGILLCLSLVWLIRMKKSQNFAIFDLCPDPWTFRVDASGDPAIFRPF